MTYILRFSDFIIQSSITDSGLLFMVQCMRLDTLHSNNKDLEHYVWHILTSRYVISAPDQYLILTCIIWSSDFALYLWLYLINKHHTLDTSSVSHCEGPHIFVSLCDLYFMVKWVALYLKPYQIGWHHTLDTCSI